MSIDKITSKIEADARAQADQILAEAKDRADKIISEAREKAAKIEQDAEKNGAGEREKVIRQREAVADIDSRKMILEEKQELIGRVFDEAVKKILSMERGPLTEFYASIAESSGLTKGEILLNGRDREKVGPVLIARLKERNPKSDFVLSDEKRDFEGGLLVKDGKIYFNGTLESFAAQAREESAAEAAAKLFG